MAEWLIRHLDHNGVTLDEFKPLNLEFSLVIDDADDVSYDISLAEPRMRWFLMGPKRTDWQLLRDGHILTAGVHTYSGSKRGSELVNCQGKSWLWYLQNRHWPINPDHPPDFLGGDAADKAGFTYRVALRHPGGIITDMLNAVMDRSNSLPIWWNALPNAGPQVHFDIPLGDTEPIYDKIKQLSDMSQLITGESDEGGFNFDIKPNMEFVIYAPHRFADAARNDPSACIHVFDDLTPPTEIVEVEFQNNGPEMTHIYGQGAGYSDVVTDQAYAFSPSDETQEIFRRWDGTVSYPDVKDKKRLRSLVQMHFSAAAYPQISLPMTVKPEAIPSFWSKFVPGQAVWINLDFEVRRVQQAFKINKITGHVDSEGNETAELDLEQIMPLGNLGVSEG